MRNKQYIIVAVILLAVFTISGCTGIKDIKYEETHVKMGTTMTIQAYGDNGQAAVKDAFARIDEIEKLTSLNIESSDVNRINRESGTGYVKVHPDVLKIIKKAVEYSNLCGGAFDVTIGPVSELWGIGTQNQRIPSSEEIKSALSMVGYRNIAINESESSVMLKKPGMIIDLGGIAKGYAADRAVEVLKNYGIKKAIVNLGGSNVYVMGMKDTGKPWSVGLQHPRKEQGKGFLGILRVSDKVISTSGDYERYFIKDDKRYHHILDPATGYPAESGITAVSIVMDGSIADGSMDSDAISTAVFVLGPEKGMQLVKSMAGVECVIATSDNRILITPGLKDKIDTISEDYKYDAQGR